MRKISIISIISGFTMILLEILFDINNVIGFILFCIGAIMIISGVFFNRKLRTIFVEFILNFL